MFQILYKKPTVLIHPNKLKKILVCISLFTTWAIFAATPVKHMSHDHSNMEQHHEKVENHSMHHSVSTIPLSIMEAGTHKAGHFMISLRHMRMSMAVSYTHLTLPTILLV